MQLLAAELGRIVDLHIATHASDNPVEMSHCEVHYISGRLLCGGSAGMRGQWTALLEHLHPDIVHVNGCWLPTCAMAQLWAQKEGYKVVLSPHGMLEPWIIHRHYLTRKLPALILYQKKAVKRADHLHATACSERDNLLKLGYNDKVSVIANGIDVESIAMKSTWARRMELLFLSRVHVKKGINYLIEAVARLKEELCGYVVRIAGEGDAAYIDSLRTLATRLGVGEMIRFEGGVYGERKWQLFREADLFVLPTHSENFGIVVAEALACGTPVVTTTGAPWADLHEQGCGWWTEIGTEPLVQALRAFLSLTEADLERMGRAGRRLVEDKYSARQVARQMHEMYENAIDENRR